MKPSIQIENISKRYLIGERNGRHQTLRESLMDVAGAPWRRLRQFFDRGPGSRGASGPDTFWALKDVSFQVQPGEVIGLIGRNGAGKSTLLKILSQITEPTCGRVMLRGRVGSLLEVGTGFHPELTGRENVYMNGGILGMTRREVTRKFDKIVEFAEVEKFLDTPVKRYSSGMYVRLAFAVAAHLEPEILLVDEVLAVGDSQFQGKCLRHLDALRKSGMTILLVSHQLETIKRSCQRVVLLDKGGLRHDGDPTAALEDYRKLIAAGQDDETPESPKAADEQPIRLTGLHYFGPDGDGESVASGKPVRFVISYRAFKPVQSPKFSLSLYSPDGRVHTGYNMAYDEYPMGDVPQGEGKVALSFPFLGLEPGVYNISLGIWTPDGFAAYDWKWAYAQIVVGGQKRTVGGFEFPHQWETTRVEGRGASPGDVLAAGRNGHASEHLAGD
jgi:lipopolysaccharide transport system ATP-binding protein